MTPHVEHHLGSLHPPPASLRLKHGSPRQGRKHGRDDVNVKLVRGPRACLPYLFCRSLLRGSRFLMSISQGRVGLDTGCVGVMIAGGGRRHTRARLINRQQRHDLGRLYPRQSTAGAHASRCGRPSCPFRANTKSRHGPEHNLGTRTPYLDSGRKAYTERHPRHDKRKQEETENDQSPITQVDRACTCSSI